MNQISPLNRLMPPSRAFPFGTDNLGRDMLSRCLYGAQLSVIIGLSAAALATVISIVIGIVTGYLGGKFDLVVQRFVDAWMSFPDLIILIVVVSVLGPGMPQIIVTLGLLLGIAGSRIIRGAVVSVRENMYVHAAQSIGASTAAHPVAAHPAQRHAADHRAVHHARRHRDPGRVGPVVPRPRRAAAGADLGRHAVGHRAAPSCSRDRGWRSRRASASPSSSMPPTCSATRCAICSIRACAARADDKPRRESGGSHDDEDVCAGLPRPVAAVLALAPPPLRSRRREAAIRRHARDRHRLRDAVGAVLGSRRLELEAEPRHRPVLRAAVRRRPRPRAKRNGGKHPFYADAWLPSDAIRGELAESWEWKENPLRVEIKLRKGVMFPEKPGVMKQRASSSADDVVFSFNRLDKSPKKIDGYFDHVDKVEATGQAHRRVHLQELQRRVGLPLRLGLLLPITPKEVADAGASNWKNVNGTGPFMLTDFVQGNSNTYSKNPIYWDKEKIDGAEYKLPFVDKIVYRTIKDEATCLTALRTGKLDILEAIRWQRVDELKKSAPQLQVVELAQHERHLPRDARRHQAVRRHPRAPRAQHGGQQAGDRQGLLRRQRRAVRLSAASRLRRLLRAAGRDARLGQGAVHLQSRRRRRSCWPRPAIRRASPSRCRSAPAIPTTWTCCRWSPPISSRSASRSRSSRWSTAPSSRP